MGQQTVRKLCSGLWSHPNRLQAPPGALLRADNAVIDRENIASKRRGMDRYGVALSGPAIALFEYLGRLIVEDGTSLKYDPDLAGTWTPWSGTFNPPSGSVPMTGLEQNLNFYFTTSLGVYVNDALTGVPIRAGVPAGLDTQLALSGTGGGWFDPDTQVGYRIVWRKKDANQNDKPGEPSFQEVIPNAKSSATWARSGGGPFTITVTHTAHGFLNGNIIEISGASFPGLNGPHTITFIDVDHYSFSSAADPGASGTLFDGKKYNVTLTFTVPSDMVADDNYEVYRTPLSADVDTTPGDEHRLVIRRALTAGEKAAGVVTYLDTFDEVFLKEPLYTNQNQEGLSQANGRPPFCHFAATFKGHTFYGRFSREPFRELALLDVEGLTDGASSITLASGGTTKTYTFDTAENQGANKFKRFTTASEGTLARAIERTAKSLIKIVNRDTTQAVWYAYYISAENDAPGRILFRKRTVNTDPITFTANDTTTGGKFSPTVPTSGTSLQTVDEATRHGLMRSKFQQPEAVPALNSHKLGAANQDMLGMIALKEALLIFKEDGVFILTGDTDGAGGFQFVTEELDPTVLLLGPRLYGLLNNAATAFTTQGMTRVSTGGTGILSRAIERDLNRISKFSLFSSLAHLVTYESYRKLLLFTPETSADTRCRIGWVWDYVTNAWTLWRKNVSCGRVLRRDDRMYLGHADDPYVLQERKGLAGRGEDQQDETIDATLTDAFVEQLEDGTLVSVVEVASSYGVDPAEGWFFRQGTHSSKVTAAEFVSPGVWALTLTRQIAGLVAGACELTLGYEMAIDWAPEDVGSAAALKDFPLAQVALEQRKGTHKLGFQADTEGVMNLTNPIALQKGGGWGSFPWGQEPWGSPGASEAGILRSQVHRSHRKCRSIVLGYRNVYAKEEVSVLECSLDYRLISSRTEKRT